MKKTQRRILAIAALLCSLGAVFCVAYLIYSKTDTGEYRKKQMRCQEIAQNAAEDFNQKFKTFHPGVAPDTTYDCFYNKRRDKCIFSLTSNFYSENTKEKVRKEFLYDGSTNTLLCSYMIVNEKISPAVRREMDKCSALWLCLRGE